MPNSLEDSTIPVNDKFLSTEGLVIRVWFNFFSWMRRRIIALQQGPQQVTQAQIAATQAALGFGDVGFLLWVTDYNHVLLWGGSSWSFAPGDNGSNYYVAGFSAAPNSVGYHAADGTVGVPFLKSDGTLGSNTVANTANLWYRQ